MQRLVTLGGWNRGVFYFFYVVTFGLPEPFAEEVCEGDSLVRPEGYIEGNSRHCRRNEVRPHIRTLALRPACRSALSYVSFGWKADITLSGIPLVQCVMNRGYSQSSRKKRVMPPNRYSPKRL